MKNLNLYLGDSKEILKQLSDNSIDLIVTDPPYGYSFMGKDWDKVLPSKEIWKECLRVLKPGAFAFVMSAPRQDVMSRMMIRLEEAGFRVDFSSIYWTYATGFPKASNIGKMVDKRLGAKRTRIKSKCGFVGSDGFKKDNQNQSGGKFGEYVADNNPVTKQAKELDGSYGGFQPKPAVEIIIVAMKPLSEKTYVDQALKNGKGITWLDDCRIPHNEEQKQTKRQVRNDKQIFSDKSCGFKSENLTSASASPKGRFPANLIVNDDVLNDGKITKSSGGSGEKSMGGLGKKVYGKYKLDKKGEHSGGLGDSGSYSRYFDLDKWWKERIKQLPESVQKTFPYLIVPKASKREKNKGCEEFEEKIIDCLQGNKDGTFNKRTNGQPSKYKNIHPTVKPIKLMSYLITLGSREGDVILDPFMGSGTTGISAKLLNRKFIGIEMSEEYMKIAMARIKGWDKDERIL